MAAKKIYRLKSTWSGWVGERDYTFPAGTIVDGEVAERIRASQPDWIEEFSEGPSVTTELDDSVAMKK